MSRTAKRPRGDLARVLHDDDLGSEVVGLLGGVVLGVGGDVATTDVLDGDVLDVEAHVVTGGGLGHGLVVHLDRLDLSGHVGRGEGADHAGLDDAGLDAAHGHCSDTTDLVHILEGETEGAVDWALGGLNHVEGLKEAGPLVPLHLVLAGVTDLADHVVTVEARDGDEEDLLHVVPSLGEEVGHLLLDLLVAGLRVRGLGVVHLVHGNAHLLDTEGVGEESVLAGLALLGDTGLELTGNHVLDEVAVARGIDDGEVVLVGLELPEGDIDGDTTLALGLELVKHPGVLEGPLAHLGGLLLELLDHALVNATALVDKVTGGGRLARVDMPDDDNVNVDLLLTHVVLRYSLEPVPM